ncbi:porphobilinogen deaminase [Tilletia horrida]|nr:porphobilinogen deaminase [Tilletia horrida]
MSASQEEHQQQLPPVGAAAAAAPPHLDPQEPQCPVPHAPNQPLPPGHPPVHGYASNLKLPGGARCIFYRSLEDYNNNTPPLSRSVSTSGFNSPPTTPSTSAPPHPQTPADLKAQANINPLPEGAGLHLDPTHSLVLASRNSQLALVQSSHVSTMLDAHYGSNSPAFTPLHSLPPHLIPASSSTTKLISKRVQELGLEKPCYFPITSMSTAGDHNQRSPLYVIGGEGRAIWTKELEVALQEGAIDAIVHCLKDIPTTLPPGLELAAICEREDPRDALVVKKGLPFTTLDELPAGSVIGTSSVRRVAQLRRRYPHLVFSDVRGNINTRINKLDSSTGPYTALVLAAAGLMRLNLSHRITAFLTSPVLYYSVGQGSLAIEVRTPSGPDAHDPKRNRDARIKRVIASIGCWRSTFRAEAERALLRELEGGCSIPVGVESRFEDHAGFEGTRKEIVGLPVKLPAAGKEGNRVVPGHFAPVRPGAGSKVNGHAPVVNHLTNGSATKKEQASGSAAAATAAAAAAAASGGEGDQTPVLVHTTETDAERKARLDALDAAIAAAANPTEDENPPYVAPMAAEDLSIPPSQIPTLHLNAIVVSLDGTRSVSHAHSRVCQTVEEARALGVYVARKLIEDEQIGAQGILAEVEQHRKWAEEADQARRKARLEGKSESEAMAIAAATVRSRVVSASSGGAHPPKGTTAGASDVTSPPVQDATKDASAADKGPDLVMVPGLGPYAMEELQKRKKLEETLTHARTRQQGAGAQAAAAAAAEEEDALLADGLDRGLAIERSATPPGAPGSQVPGSGTAGVQVEVDRRFVPRDDGQPKAWEV